MQQGNAADSVFAGKTGALQEASLSKQSISSQNELLGNYVLIDISVQIGEVISENTPS